MTIQHMGAQVFYSDYHEKKEFAELSVERAAIYTPAPDNWHYAHHPSIAFFQGKFIAIFSNGINGEDEPFQRVQSAYSSGFGTWSEPEVLVATDSAHVLTPGGLFVANDSMLVAYYTKNDAGRERANSNLFACTSRDGISWSEPLDLQVPLFPCHRPTVLKSGRLLITGNRDFYYSDDPNGISGWTRAAKRYFSKGDTARLVEGSVIVHSDSVYTLFRDAGKHLLWQQSSSTGESWSRPRRTKFPDNDSKFHLGRLPDGRYYYIGTPDTLVKGVRTPLVLSVSTDGFYFGNHFILAKDHYEIQYKEGRWKAGQFGYPYSIIRGDHMYVIISRRKEKIEVMRFTLSQLNR